MRVRRTAPPDFDAQMFAAASPYAELVAEAAKPKAKTRRPESERALLRACDEFQVMQRSGAYNRMTASHFVALYALLHREVYGAEPLELLTAFAPARSAADKLVRDEFGNRIERMFEFMRWVWQRERASEKRRRQDGVVDGRRINWRLMFATRHLVTDYRVELARRSALNGATR